MNADGATQPASDVLRSVQGRMLKATTQVTDALAERSEMALLLHQQSSKDSSDLSHPQQALAPTPAVWPAQDQLDAATEASSLPLFMNSSAVSESADSQAESAAPAVSASTPFEPANTESAPAAAASTPAPAQQKTSGRHHWCWRHVCPHNEPLAFLAVVVAGVIIFVACVWACMVLSGVCLVCGTACCAFLNM